MKRSIIFLLSFVLACAIAILLQDSSSASNTPAKNATYSKDVAPIFFKNCAECHRPGEGCGTACFNCG